MNKVVFDDDIQLGEDFNELLCVTDILLYFYKY